MIKTKSILFYFLFAISFLNAQNVILEHQLDEKFKFGYVSIIPNKINNLGLFFFGQKVSKALLLDQSMKTISSFNFNGIPFDFQYRLEGIAQNEKFLFLFKDRFDKKLAIAKYNMGNGESEFKKDLIGLKKEIYLQSFVDKDTPYVLTINKNSSILNLYSFNIEGEFIKNVIDLSSIKFRYWNNDIVSLSKLIEKPFGSEAENFLSKIDATKPNSLESTSNASKMFVEKNKIHLVFESNRSISQSITIDLSDFSYTSNVFNKPFIVNAEKGKKSNSFILNDTYFGISGTSEVLALEIKNLKSRKVINTIKIERNKRLPLNNVAINFEGTGLKNRSGVVQDTNKFLNTISNNEVGISAYKNEGDYVISFGSFKEGTGGFGFGFGGLSLQISALYSYSTTKSTFIKTLFDKNFIHLEGEVQKTKYDMVKDFITENGKGKKEIIKEINGDYFYGTFDKKDAIYSLRKF